MHEHHVGKAADIPPASNILPKRPKGVTVTRQPFVPVLSNIARGRCYRWTYASRGVVEYFVPQFIRVRMVIIHTPNHVTSVARNVNIFRRRREPKRVDRKMRLDKPSVRLCFHQWELHLFGGNAQVEPGRHLPDFKIGSPIEKQLGDNLLHPGRSGLGICRNDDVVVAKRQIVAHRGIKVMVVELSRFLWPLDLFVHKTFCC